MRRWTVAAVIALSVSPSLADDHVASLVRDLSSANESDPASLDAATKAAKTLGTEHVVSAADALIAVVRKPVTKKLFGLEVASIRALGQIGGDKRKLAGELVSVLDRTPPANPRTARDPATARQLDGPYSMFLATRGAAINALGELHAPGVVKPLVLAMYRTPELFAQTRRALVLAGPEAKPELVRAFRGDSAEVNQLFRDRKLDKACLRDGSCHPVSAREFYAAVILGDFHDASVVPDLVAALAHPPLPVYYDEDDARSPNTQHDAILDALRKIGSQAAAGPVRALWQSTTADLSTRVAAIGAYPFVARDASDAAALGAIAADNTADDSLRQEAATALARLSRDPEDIDLIQRLAKRYLDASAAKAREAAKLVAGAEDADREFEAATKAAKSSAERREAKRRHDERTAPYKMATGAERAYRGYARMFQAHIARIEIAMRCKADPSCYAGSLTATTDASAAAVQRYIPDLASWSGNEKRELVVAAIERATIELGKLGPSAAPYTGELLDAAGSDDRYVRQAALLALPHVVKLPCPGCVAKLDAVLVASEGKPTIADLTVETRLVRDYFGWATP
jgi:hypothetical protein